MSKQKLSEFKYFQELVEIFKEVSNKKIDKTSYDSWLCLVGDSGHYNLEEELRDFFNDDIFKANKEIQEEFCNYKDWIRDLRFLIKNSRKYGVAISVQHQS